MTIPTGSGKKRPSPEFPEQRWIKNEEYTPKYEQFTARGGKPQLAGEEFNLDKYKRKDVEAMGFRHLVEKGEPVGWTGAFPFIGPLKKCLCQSLLTDIFRRIYSIDGKENEWLAAICEGHDFKSRHTQLFN